MSAGIYEIVHISSGKKYIGSSINVKSRLAGHRRDLKRQAHTNFRLQRAWNKHGAEAFEFRVIEFFEGPIHAMVTREQFHIDKTDPALRYNRRPIASSNAGIKMPSASEALRARRAEVGRALGTRIRSEEERAKISASLTDRKNGPPSEETRRKIAVKIWGMKHSAETIKKMKPKAEGRKLPERTPEIDAKIKVALRAAWVRRKARIRLEA
jgi:group I intron endonuclease